MLFRFQHVLGITNDGLATLDENATEAQKAQHGEKRKEKDENWLSLIHQYLNSNIFEEIIEGETSKSVWGTHSRKFMVVMISSIRSRIKH